jgi:hypothetical protein
MGCGNAQLCHVLKMIRFPDVSAWETQAMKLQSYALSTHWLWLRLPLSFLGIEHELVEIYLSRVVSKSRPTSFG